MNNNCTIVITTFNRYTYLLRLLKYYSYFDFPYKIKILDSSSDTIENEELLNLFSNDRITYMKFPANVFISNKLAKGLEGIDSTYTVLCADDDFIIPSGIEKCLNFLTKNSDYGLATGLNVVHNVNKNIIGTDKFSWTPIYTNLKSVEMNDPITRLEFHLSNYVSTFYAVHRTSLLKLCWNQTISYTDTWGINEIFSSGLSIIYSKMKILDVFYASRQLHHNSWFDEECFNKSFSQENVGKMVMGFINHMKNMNNQVDLRLGAKIEKCLDTYIKLHSSNRNVKSRAIKRIKVYWGETKFIFILKRMYCIVSRITSSYRNIFYKLKYLKFFYLEDDFRVELNLLRQIVLSSSNIEQEILFQRNAYNKRIPS